MKKLLDELQTEIERRDLKEAALEGLFLALQIVHAHNPWVSVEELLPPFESEWSVMSEIVLLKDEDGEIYRGYYTLETNTYKTKAGFAISPTHWAYLPEVK